MTTNKEAAKARTALLKDLREQHKETVQRTQTLLKEQKAVRRSICQVMRDAPKTVPEIAQASGLPTNEVLWHIIAMKKYDQVTEADMCGEYYLYQMVKESKK
jgi:predicted Rossmann fold nucleotide-binding protein DprA/Smf involved in DNA uptake